MTRGGKIIGTAAMLSLAACGSQEGRLEIRPIKAPLAAGLRPVPFRIAEARGQLALGNVALALESFRTALREDPESIDAMTGVAACYDRMGRFDLSRRNYEAALAVAPGDTQLLTAFAGSLDRQGNTAEAAGVRQEIKQRIALAAQDAAPPPAPLAVLAVATATAAPVGPPTPRPLVLSGRAEPAHQIDPAHRAALAPALPSSAVRIAQLVPPAAPTPVGTSPIGRSVTVTLPVARPAATPVQRPNGERVVTLALASQQALPAAPPPPAPAAINRPAGLARGERDMAEVSGSVSSGPRLERVSLREVELITRPAPQWRALNVARTQRSATVRFIPLREAATRPAGVRVLNAARVDRLAARTRLYLADRGWRAISIGNSPAVRTQSVILYPIERRRMAERLSAQFGFPIARRQGATQVTILLGRDAARDSALRARG